MTIYAVGDIHGDLTLLTKMRSELASRCSSGDTIVYLGDYVDRGPESFGVVDCLCSPIPDVTEVFLMGNHERFFIEALDPAINPRQSKMELGISWYVAWLFHGGIQTLNSYKIQRDILPSLGDIKEHYCEGVEHVTMDMISNLRNELQRVVPPHHIEFLRNLKLMHVQDNFVFAHAGIDPNRKLSSQEEDTLLWVRNGGIQTKYDHYTIVHGHTIYPSVYISEHRIGCDTGAFTNGVLSAVDLTSNEVIAVKYE